MVVLRFTQLGKNTDAAQNATKKLHSTATQKNDLKSTALRMAG